MSGKIDLNKKNNQRIQDLIVVILLLSISGFFVNLFRLDFTQTLRLKNVKPVGTVVLKKNTVQRRLSNRVLWDRVTNESPVYIGDLIRVADVSSAALNIEDNKFDLEENTLIRIMRSEDGESIQINFAAGKISLTAGSGGNVIIGMNGVQIQADGNTQMSAEAGANGRYSVQVTNGSASFIGERAGRVINSGMAITMDAAGNEIMQRTAVVTSPPANARYLNNSFDPFAVNFEWNRINLDPSQALRLDIARDRNFDSIFRVVDNLDNRAQVLLDSGLWFWRLSHEDTVLTAGNLTIADGDLKLNSPAQDSLFRYEDDFPVVNFYWEEAEDAVSYIIEISKTPDFNTTNIRYNSSGAFYSESRLDQGLWYWRVMPVFPPVYQGAAAFSRPASFRIERGVFDEDESLASYLASISGVELPPVAAPPPAPPPPTPAPLVSRPAPAPVTLLPAPRIIFPVAESVFDHDQVQSMTEIVFRWSAVQGANEYVFTLYQQSSSGRRQILRTTGSGTSYTLTDLSLLDRGNFVWQVEARSTSNGAIERRGNTAEGVFIFDFQPPTSVQIEDTGILYGN